MVLWGLGFGNDQSVSVGFYVEFLTMVKRREIWFKHVLFQWNRIRQGKIATWALSIVGFDFDYDESFVMTMAKFCCAAWFDNGKSLLALNLIKEYYGVWFWQWEKFGCVGERWKFGCACIWQFGKPTKLFCEKPVNSTLLLSRHFCFVIYKYCLNQPSFYHCQNQALTTTKFKHFKNQTQAATKIGKKFGCGILFWEWQKFGCCCAWFGPCLRLTDWSLILIKRNIKGVVGFDEVKMLKLSCCEGLILTMVKAWLKWGFILTEVPVWSLVGLVVVLLDFDNGKPWESE